MKETHRGCPWQACSSPSSPSAIRWSNRMSRGSWRGRDAPGNKWAEIQEKGGWWGCCCLNGEWSSWSCSQKFLPQCKEVGSCPGTEPPVPPSHWTRCWTHWLTGYPRGWAFWDGWGPWRQAQGDQTANCRWGRSSPIAQGPERLDRESRWCGFPGGSGTCHIKRNAPVRTINKTLVKEFLQQNLKKIYQLQNGQLLSPTWDCWGLTGSCRRLLRSCSPPDRCESGSPSLWWLRESSGSCSENTAAPSAPFARWRCDRGCWRGYSRTSRGAPASLGL